MTIDVLFKKLSNKKFLSTLEGEISLEIDSIKWFYDGLLNQEDCSMTEHLINVAESDKELISDLMSETDADEIFNITEPEYDETFATFFISE
jgi:hypothetical protein